MYAHLTTTHEVLSQLKSMESIFRPCNHRATVSVFGSSCHHNKVHGDIHQVFYLVYTTSVFVSPCPVPVWAPCWCALLLLFFFGMSWKFQLKALMLVKELLVTKSCEWILASEWCFATHWYQYMIMWIKDSNAFHRQIQTRLQGGGGAHWLGKQGKTDSGHLLLF